MHLLERILDAQRGKRGVRVRGHDPDDGAPLRVETRSDDPEDNVLGGKDTNDLLDTTDNLHDTDSRRPALLHDGRRLADGSPGRDSRGRLGGVHDGRQVREGHLVSEGVDIGEHRRRLGVGRDAWAARGWEVGMSVR